MTPALGHPLTDPGDGRLECDTCGKFVFLAIHSCKRVPVTQAAWLRHRERVTRDASSGPTVEPQAAQNGSGVVPDGPDAHSGSEWICGHCGEPMRGMASSGDTWLCHPDDGIDCYRLVTLYGHPTPCDRLEADRAYFEAVDDFTAERRA